MRRHPLHCCQQTARRGSLIVETIVAAIILGSAISMLVPAMSAIRHQRQAHRFESLAMVELNNIAEFLPSADDTTQPPALSEWFRSRYAKANLDSEVLPPTAEDVTTLQAVRLTIHQPSFASVPEQRVSVVVWQRIEEPTR